MKKRIISLSLVLALVLAISSSAFASITVTTSLDFSHTSPFSITISSDQLIFSLPDDSEFNFLRISLEDRNEREFNVLFTSRQSGDISVYNLSNIRDGTYFLQLYISPVEFGSYKSYIVGKAVKTVIRDSSAHFELAPTYEANTRVFNSKRTDSEALAFYRRPSSGVQSDHISIRALADNITRGITGSFERARAIHDWVCNNIWYDRDVLYNRAPYGEQSALSTLNSKRGVCLGYANLTAALLRAAGIPAKVIIGYTLDLETDSDEWTNESAGGRLPANHAWNEFFANGRWVIMDPTLNTSNVYDRGSFSADTGLYNRFYFDITLEVFSSSHLIYEYSERQIPAFVEPAPAPAATAAPNRSQVLLNGRVISFESYTINNENYFKLRDIMHSINGTPKQFHAVFDQTTRAIALITNTPYIPDGSEMRQGDGTAKSATPTASKIYKDGKEITLKAYTIGGNNFFRMRDIAREFNIFVAFVDGVIVVDTARDYIES
jgi:transglutaminase-like putative cysteine protease